MRVTLERIAQFTVSHTSITCPTIYVLYLSSYLLGFVFRNRI